jgi:hypothetical protein
MGLLYLLPDGLHRPTKRRGCKHHLLVDQRGLPLVAQIAGAQVRDSRLFTPRAQTWRL